MNEDVPDPSDIAGKMEDVAEYFSRVGQYDIEDLRMEDEKELVENAVGAVSAFYTAAEELDELYEAHIDQEVDDSDMEAKAYEVGVAWPAAFQAYNTVKDAVDFQEVNDKAVNAAMRESEAEKKKSQTGRVDTAPGIASSRKESPLDMVFGALDELVAIEDRYQIGRAYAETASEYMNARDMTHPVGVALEHAEDEETIEYFREIEEDLPDSVEEEHEEFVEMFEELADQS